MVKRNINADIPMEDALEGQIPEYAEEVVSTPENENTAESYIGTKLGHKIGGYADVDKAADNELVKEKNLSRVGENILHNSEIRDGWMTVDRQLLGERDNFYPEDWEFRIKPATVEAIRNWSTLDENNANSIDDVFNEILKACLSIKTNAGQIPWSSINSWDRFFFVMLIREYTFINGDAKITFNEECTNCDAPLTFDLSSQNLMYDLPDADLMKLFTREDRTWFINPEEYDVIGYDSLVLYTPTIEKDMNIKAYLIERYQENKNAKIDTVFIKFLSWLAPKISKDTNIAKKQIREFEIKFKSWDTDMFSFMNDVITNIAVTPSTNLITTCPACGEEVTFPIRFQDGIKSLFTMVNRHKKFGSK